MHHAFVCESALLPALRAVTVGKKANLHTAFVCLQFAKKFWWEPSMQHTLIYLHLAA